MIHRARAKRGHRDVAADRYTLTSANIGHRIRVVVIAHNSHGTTSASSRATRIVRRRVVNTPTPTSTPTPAPAAGLHVVENRLLDARGNVVVLRGVDRSGTEYACQQGLGITDGPTGSSEFSPMGTWKINSVFMGLNEDCWLGINGSNPAGQAYIDGIKSEATAAEAAGLYVVIGYFWGDPGSEVPHSSDPNGGGQPPLPDNDHAPLFWQQLADTFKSDPNVIFRLQEEPHPAGNSSGPAAWTCWNAGDVQYSPTSVRSFGTAPSPTSRVPHCNETSTNGSTHYATVGMQSLINIVRGTGATNVIQVPGVQYANMTACNTNQSPNICGFLAPGTRVSDTLSPAQLMADVDVYPDGNPCGSTSCYNATYAPIIAQMPFAAGETGPGNTTVSVDQFLSWMDGHSSGYFAWAWDTWAGLISNYDGTAQSPWGTDYKRHLAAVQ